MLLQCFCLFLLVHAGADPEGTAGGGRGWGWKGVRGAEGAEPRRRRRRGEWGMGMGFFPPQAD